MNDFPYNLRLESDWQFRCAPLPAPQPARYASREITETNKSQLKHESDAEIEKIKSQLQIEAAKRNIQYSKIFEEIANTVVTVYEKLVVFKDAVSNYVSMVEWQGEPPREEKRGLVQEKMNDFLGYYKSRKIYLPEKPAKQIDPFWQGLYEISIDFMYDVEKGSGKWKEEKETWKKAYQYMSKEVPEVLKALEEEFRSILGVDTAHANTEQITPPGHQKPAAFSDR